jgi:hypothetical protein
VKEIVNGSAGAVNRFPIPVVFIFCEQTEQRKPTARCRFGLTPGMPWPILSLLSSKHVPLLTAARRPCAEVSSPTALENSEATGAFVRLSIPPDTYQESTR